MRRRQGVHGRGHGNGRSVPTLPDIDHIARLNHESIDIAVGQFLGVDLDGLHGIPLASLDPDVTAVGDPGESSRHADGLEEIERFTLGILVGSGLVDLPDDGEFDRAVGCLLYTSPSPRD